MHYHHCPNCYEKWKCELACTIEPDLQDEGREFGAHATCPVCDKQVQDKEFWDVYHGFKKRMK